MVYRGRRYNWRKLSRWGRSNISHHRAYMKTNHWGKKKYHYEIMKLQKTRKRILSRSERRKIYNQYNY